MSIGAHIRDLRWGHRLNQGELAHRAGIAQNTLSRIELGETTPSVPTLEKIARGLGISLSDLLVEEEAVPLGEAPQETGQPKRKPSVFDVARDAALTQAEEDRQLFARAAASENVQVQESFVRHLNEAARRLREEYPAADLAEGCVDLARRNVELEQENARLMEALEESRREAARQ